MDPSHQNGSRRSYLWVYVGDRDEVVFDFTIGRGREGSRAFLGDYRGLLQVDAYAGYDVVFQSGQVTEVGCMAHARRRFFDALDGEKEQAGHALAVLRRLYWATTVARESFVSANRFLRSTSPDAHD
ncbi:MAG: transposase [Acidobacteria bacterium]|nr:transposase [Acidobacteriota bacterium]